MTSFNRHTLGFIEKAARQKRPDWLEKNRKEYEKRVLRPLQGFVSTVKQKILPIAPGYHFPQKGIGRLKRSARKAREYGAPFRDYVSYSASRPSESRFDKNPSLFFLLHPFDEDGDEVLIAGGLYMPSSRQVRAVREAIAKDASAFEELFASKAFNSRFPGGFCREKVSSRPPRGFDKEHPRMDWLKLQAFFVWRSYEKTEFISKGFADLVAKDFTQIVRMNELLEKAVKGTLPGNERVKRNKKSSDDVLSRIEDVVAPRRQFDFT